MHAGLPYIAAVSSPAYSKGWPSRGEMVLFLNWELWFGYVSLALQDLPHHQPLRLVQREPLMKIDWPVTMPHVPAKYPSRHCSLPVEIACPTRSNQCRALVNPPPALAVVVVVAAPSAQDAAPVAVVDSN